MSKARYDVTDTHVELYFGDYPSINIRESLKICGWRWFGIKKCWSNRKTEENINMAKVICEQLNPVEDPLSNLPTSTIEFEDIIIRCNSFYCNVHHNVEDVAGIVTLMRADGTFYTKKVPMAYCRSCNTYYMLENTYLDIAKFGCIFSRIMKQDDYIKYGSSFDSGGALREIGPLKSWGYSVGKAEGLSAEQRRNILAKIIDKDIMKKDRIMSYLDMFIRMSSNEDSIACWKEDRRFVSQYWKGTTKTVYVK